MKSFIGITPLIDKEKESFWMLPAYMEMVSLAGGIPCMLPPINNLKDIESLVDKFDGFIIAGGPDVNPKIYNEEKMDFCGEIIVERDELEVPLLVEILKYKKPILGVCRGFQLMNSLLGGSLYQDIPTQFKSNVNHRQDKPYINPIHRVHASGLLAEIIGKNSLMVNSCHHQGIKILSDKLETVGKSDDGLVEAAIIKDYPFGLGVQWHPEMLYKKDAPSVAIFKAFIASCKK